MKRRAFIGLLGASALSLPFILSEQGLGLGKRNARTSTKNRIPLRLKLPKDVAEITALLGESSKGVYLLGGTVAAAVAGAEPPYLNLLIDTKKLTSLKQLLFKFGVTPVATADLPGNFIRFIYQDKAYNVLNMSFDTYAQLNAAGRDHNLILFAHNFLVYSVKEAWALDPYAALECRAADKKSLIIKPLEQPKTLLRGFEHCLAATFDCALLGLQPSPEYNQLEERLFHSTPNESDSKEITSLVLDYTSDILEVGGLETASRLLLSPLCVDAAKNAAEIDFVKVESNLRRLQRQGTEITGREFMNTVHVELKKKTSGKGAAQGLTEYLIAVRNPFRRVEVLLEATESKIA